MQYTKFNLSAQRLLRMLVAVCVCVFLFVSTAFPATAATSKPTQGEENLTQIELKSQKAAQSDPYSREKTQAEANQGINEVQGAADADKMKRPDNANATSFEEQVENLVENLTNKSK